MTANHASLLFLFLKYWSLPAWAWELFAAYKVVFILEKRHKLSVEKKKVKKNKKRLELEAEIAARYRKSVGHVETMELAAEPAKPNHPDVVLAAERNRFTYEPQT